eukprot:TRINITY_DN4088_c2_g1_i6.p1 TRINITY_DN4088_c2_g1~~TRINITY_DN4088_c2_g1_i6.p1  ORF type:complete len:217 (-),score=-18.58 TRINITY_DN4088_c2_g1_i6:1438-2088(-)
MNLQFFFKEIMHLFFFLLLTLLLHVWLGWVGLVQKTEKRFQQYFKSIKHLYCHYLSYFIITQFYCTKLTNYISVWQLLPIYLKQIYYNKLCFDITSIIRKYFITMHYIKFNCILADLKLFKSFLKNLPNISTRLTETLYLKRRFLTTVFQLAKLLKIVRNALKKLQIIDFLAYILQLQMFEIQYKRQNFETYASFIRNVRTFQSFLQQCVERYLTT